MATSFPALPAKKQPRNDAAPNQAKQLLSKSDSYRALLAAVIYRAMDDLKGKDPRCRRIETDRAMAFVLGETCEAYCLGLGIDCEMIREKAAALYRRIVKKDAPAAAKKKRPGRPPKGLCRVPTRQRPGKRRIASGR